MLPLTNGSFRNHCPECLWSLHVDIHPGDRASPCGAPMEPLRLVQPRGKSLAVEHRCTRCGHRQANRLALDDRRQPDSFEAIAELQRLQLMG